MRQILGKQSLTLSKQRRRNDEAIPNGEAVAFDDIQGSRKDCKGILLDRKSLPALNQRQNRLVTKRAGTAGPCHLSVEFLQHLNRYNAIVTSKNLVCPFSFGGFCRIG